MTLLSDPESRATRDRRRRSLPVRLLKTLIAVLKARAELRRITRPVRQDYREIPPHLRRDLGLPEDDPLYQRIIGTDPTLTILAYGRLK
ncbi:hypothetical protein [Devosia sp.]|jgi:hypothetical protein|uniref:hypothetical protein n=1 Tax=Devosia sp. TaxID=1871048 RepID=UPI0037BEAF93